MAINANWGQPCLLCHLAAAVLSARLTVCSSTSCILPAPCLAGVEVFFLQPPPDSDVGGPFWGAPSAFFAFKGREEREAFIAAIMGQAELGSALPGGRHVAAACGSILEVGGVLACGNV